GTNADGASRSGGDGAPAFADDSSSFMKGCARYWKPFAAITFFRLLLTFLPFLWLLPWLERFAAELLSAGSTTPALLKLAAFAAAALCYGVLLHLMAMIMQFAVVAGQSWTGGIRYAF